MSIFVTTGKGEQKITAKLQENESQFGVFLARMGSNPLGRHGVESLRGRSPPKSTLAAEKPKVSMI